MTTPVLVRQLNTDQKLSVARICYNAFAQKFRVFLLFEDDAHKGAACLFDCINYDTGIYAADGGQVLGFVGLDYGKERFETFCMRSLKKHYGVWGALWRSVVAFLFRVLFERVKKDEVHISAIAASAESRGKGVGTMLLNAAFEQAQALGYRRITLDVVDTNLRAKKLYEKMGFKVYKTECTGAITASAGFTAVDKMVKSF